jgi:asparagine N-glycosylation enzyme membrane subunit Stt3
LLEIDVNAPKKTNYRSYKVCTLMRIWWVKKFIIANKLLQRTALFNRSVDKYTVGTVNVVYSSLFQAICFHQFLIGCPPYYWQKFSILLVSG